MLLCVCKISEVCVLEQMNRSEFTLPWVFQTRDQKRILKNEIDAIGKHLH